MDILDKMVSIMIGAIVVGALIVEALNPIINITNSGVNNSSLLPESLSAFNIFFALIIPLLIVFGIVKYFRRIAEE